jgi:hypothetical protein
MTRLAVAKQVLMALEEELFASRICLHNPRGVADIITA